MTSAISLFHCGDYERACEEARGGSSTADTRSAWFRALVHLGRSDEAQQMLAAGDGALDHALRLYASGYLLKDEPSADWSFIVEGVKMATGLEGDRDESAHILAIVYTWAGRYEEAYRLASQSAAMEAQLLLVTILAKIGRFDLVERKMEKLKRFAGDDVAYQIVEAQISIEKGGAGMKDAVYIYQELVETRGRIPKLLTNLAAALLLVGRHSEAEPLILEVLQANPHDAQALSLLINFSIAKGAGLHLVNDQLARLAAADKNPPFLKLMENYASPPCAEAILGFETAWGRDSRMGQSINYAALWGLARSLFRPRLYIPACSAKDIGGIDFAALRAAGYEAICFDKDNTLTLPYETTLSTSLQGAWDECRRHFDRVSVISNSAGTPDDPRGEAASKLESTLGVPVIRHKYKKPACAEEIIKHFGVDAPRIVLVGDRLSTDVEMANRWGMLSIHTRPLGVKDDNPNARRVREAENWILSRLDRPYARADLQERFVRPQ